MTRRAPALTAMSLLQREINQLFERLADIDRSDGVAAGEWTPSIDVFESRGALVVVAEVPGLPPESIRVVVRDRELSIGGERRERRPAGGIDAFLCMERPSGRFERTIPLDVAVDVKQARALLGGGLLTVTLPRLKDRRGRETVIAVERNEER